MIITPIISSPATIDYLPNPNFGYKSILKKEFLSGKIPLKKDITGHKLNPKYLSVDHTIPKNKGG